MVTARDKGKGQSPNQGFSALGAFLSNQGFPLPKIETLDQAYNTHSFSKLKGTAENWLVLRSWSSAKGKDKTKVCPEPFPFSHEGGRQVVPVRTQSSEPVRAEIHVAPHAWDHEQGQAAESTPRGAWRRSANIHSYIGVHGTAKHLHEAVLKWTNAITFHGHLGILDFGEPATRTKQNFIFHLYFTVYFGTG